MSKRILHVIPYSKSKSSFIFAKRQAIDIENEGFISEFFFVNTNFSPFSIFKEFLRLRKVSKKFKPDIVHSHYGTITGFLASTIKNSALVVSFQGSDLNFTNDVSFMREKVGKLLSKITAKRAKLIICVSKSLQCKLKAGRDKSIVMAYGIDTYVFKTIEKSIAKKKLGLDLNQNYLFFNANNPIVKRLDIAEKIILELTDLNVSLLKLDGQMDPDEIPFYLNASKLLLMCSDSEGSPMVIKEALACNLPIVSVDVGDVKERILNVDFCYVEKQSVHDLSKRIRFIVENNIENTNGIQKLIEDGIDSKSVAKKLKKLYLAIK